MADDEIATLLVESAEALFARHSSVDARRTLRPGELHEALWQQVTAAEFALLGVPEERGGAGGTLEHWAAVIRVAGRHAAAIPLAETTTAAWLAAEAGLEVPTGPLGLVRGGFSQAVPYARYATAFIALEDERVSIVAPVDATVTPGLNIAGEARDDVRFGPVAAATPAQSGPFAAGRTLASGGSLAPGGSPARSASLASSGSLALADALALRLALGRALLISGALDGALAVTLAHVRDRVQFGVPLAKLPVVRDRLSILAEEVAAARAVTHAAVASPDPHTIAAAKIRAGEAAGAGARLSHQLIGALGMTDEHELQHFTRRLWAWRDEDGNEREWAERLGRTLMTAGGSALWPRLTA